MPGKKVVELDQDQVFDLADRTWHHESEARHRIPFRSENERVQYLKQSMDGRDTVKWILTVLDDRRTSEEDQKLSAAFNSIYNYILLSYSFAFQFVSEAWLRFKYIGKITAQAKIMSKEVENAAGNIYRLESIAIEAAWWRNVLKDYVGRSQGTHAAFFSRWLKRNNMTIEDLMKKYMKKFGFSGAFRDLEPQHQVQVWNKIIEASGQERFVITRDLAGLGVVGLGVLSVTACLLVADIYKSKNRVETALKDGLNLAAAHWIAIDAYSVLNLTTVYGDLLPEQYEDNSAEAVFGEDLVIGDISVGEAVSVAQGVQGDMVAIQVVGQGAVDIEAAGEEAANFVPARFAVAEETTTLVMATEEVVASGGLLACGLAGGAPLAFVAGIVVLEGVSGYAAGIVIGKVIDGIWDGIRYLRNLA